MLHSQYEEGQGLVEYALILVLIAVAVILVLTFLGEQVGDILGTVGSALEDAEQVDPSA